MDDTGTKTLEEIAQEARAAGRDAARAAQGLAQEARAIAGETADDLRSHAADAKATGQQAIDTARGVAGDAKDVARDAARNANARLDRIKEQAGELKVRGERYVAEQPLRSTLYAMASGAALAAMLMSFMRGRRD